ncbi:hypothetical protein BJF78_24755 [Pseudonocardia sp. CNS-139]|nr:hypothetical protein BJF78_24755 [Pseudonocardia sp. CNS-139]
MGILDALANIVSGSGKQTIQIQFEEGEVERARVTASWNPGTLKSVGGDLVLTNRRLIFTPLDVRDVVEVLTWGLGKAGAPEAVTGLPSKIGGVVSQHVIAGSTSIVSGRDAALNRPPTVFIRSTDGAQVEIGILAERTSMNISPKNPPVREAFIAAVRAELG